MGRQTPPFARADVHDLSEHQKTLCFVGQNSHVHDHGFHLATHSLDSNLCVECYNIVIIVVVVVVVIIIIINPKPWTLNPKLHYLHEISLESKV